jgi:hypothetical protein
MFLRHLRRTRLLLQVVDASAADPGTDYLAVREELRMYNPDYVTRPHVVALNKVDLEDAGECACGQLVSAHKVGMGAACESVYLEIGEPRDQQQACAHRPRKVGLGGAGCGEQVLATHHPHQLACIEPANSAPRAGQGGTDCITVAQHCIRCLHGSWQGGSLLRYVGGEHLCMRLARLVVVTMRCF